MGVLMLFLDGVGIGVRNPAVNPHFAAGMPALRSILGGELPSLNRRRIYTPEASLIPLDATLGVPGLPQSGTGQAALFTGVNGAAVAGRHFGPHPHSTLKHIIAERNIFRRMLDSRKRPLFANAFPQRFFDYMEQKRSRLTVTTLSYVSSGLPLLRESDLAAGRAVSADITNSGWHALGYPLMATVAPGEAGGRLARLAEEYDFVLFEYWKTDQAGHAMNMHEAVEVLEAFDAMLGGILLALNPRQSLMVMTSDHGNIEDLSVKTHTRHPVPLLLYGRRQHDVAAQLGERADLTAVTPAIMSYMNGDV